MAQQSATPKQSTRFVFFLQALLIPSIMAQYHFENRSYDIFCSSYTSSTPDICDICATPISGKMGYLYDHGKQDCKTSVSNGTCVIGYQEVNGQPYTYCLANGYISAFQLYSAYYECEKGCALCYSVDSGNLTAPTTQTFSCLGCYNSLARVVTNVVSIVENSVTYIGNECTRECQAHPNAKFYNGSVTDQSYNYGRTPISVSINVCMDCGSPTYAKCAIDALTSNLKIYECLYTCKRFPEGFTSGSTYKGFLGTLTDADCTCSATKRANGPLSLTYYVDSVFNPGCPGPSCDGSAAKPFDDIYWVAYNLAYNPAERITDYLESSVTIYLNPGTHYWLDKNTQGAQKHDYDMTGKNELLRMFERAHVNITIKPTACKDSPEGQCDPSNSVTVKLKTQYFSLFVSNYLSIENVIFDAADLSSPVNSTCWYNRIICCAYDSATGAYVPTSSAPPGYQCDTIPLDKALANTSLPGSGVGYAPLYTVTQPLGFINLRFLKDYSNARYPRVSIYNTQILNFYNYNAYSYYLSFIHVDVMSGHVKLSNVSVNNYFFPRGFISNYGNLYEDPLTERIYTCKGAGTTAESSSTDCYSLQILNSNFNYYNKQLYQYLYTTYRAVSTTPPTSVSWQQKALLQEGAVVNLQSFDGAIEIKSTVFQNSVSAAHDLSMKYTNDSDYLYHHNCYKYGTQSNNNLTYHSGSSSKIHLDRHIRKLWVDDSTKSGSLINIRYLSKGLILYNNTFDANIGHTGSALFIKEFRDTKTYPIIIDKNTFTNNFVYQYGLTIVIFKNGIDYIKNACHGISITNNNFTNNMGCYNAFGNVMIVCDSSELPSSASGFSSYNLEDFWDPRYTLSKDQQGETGGFAKLNFTSYMLYMKDKEENPVTKTSPTDGSEIDLYRITVNNNSFQGNLASGSNGLYIQGAFRVSVQDNTFYQNGYYTASAFSSSTYSSNAWKKLLLPRFTANNVSNSLPSEPYVPSTIEIPCGTTSNVVVTMGSFINLNGNAFKSSYTDNIVSARYIGSAITLHLMMAYGNVTISNCVFQDSQSTSSPNQAGLTYQLQPIISYSLYEDFFAHLVEAYSVIPTNPSSKIATITNDIKTLFQQWIANGYYSDVTIQNATFSGFEWGGLVSAASTEYLNLPSSFTTLFKFYTSSETLESISSSTIFYTQTIVLDGPIPNVRLIIQDSQFTNLVDSSPGCLFMQSYNYLTSLNNITFTNNQHPVQNDNYDSEFGYPGFFCLFPPSSMNYESPGGYQGPLYMSGKPLTTFRLSNFTYKGNKGIIIATSAYTDTLLPESYLIDTWEVTESSLEDTPADSSLIMNKKSSFTINNTIFDGLNARIADLSTASIATTFQDVVIQNGQELTAPLVVATSSTAVFNNLKIVNNSYAANSDSGNMLFSTTGESNISLINSSIQNNTCGEAIIGASLDLWLTIDSTTVANNAFSRDFLLTAGSVFFSNSSFSHNIVGTALVVLNSKADFVLKTTNFTSNLCYDCKAVLFYSLSATRFDIESSNFILNNASSVNPMTASDNLIEAISIIYTISTVISIKSSVFQYNSGGSKYLFKVQLGTLEITSSVFEHNYGSQETGIDLISCKLSVKDARFTNNTAAMSSMLFSLSVSNHKNSFEHCIFENNSLADPTTLVSVYSFIKILNFEVAFRNCIFRNSHSTVSAIYADATKHEVSFVQCTFTNNTGMRLHPAAANITAGAVSGNAMFVFDGCQFANNKGLAAADIYLKANRKVTIFHSSFVDHAITAVNASSVQRLTIINCTFVGNPASNMSRGLALIDVEGSNITRALFYNHTLEGDVGAGISITSSVSISKNQAHGLVDCTFINNSAEIGGALHIDTEMFEVEITDTNFSCNKAVKRGGALYFVSNMTNSIVTIAGSTSFVNNSATSAEGAGGAIYSQGQRIKYVGSAYSFTDNHAAYGGHIGTYPTSLKKLTVSGYNASMGLEQYLGTYINKFDYNPAISRLLEKSSTYNPCLDSDNPTGIVLASGKQSSPPIMFVLCDEFGQLYIIDNSSKLEAEGVKNSDGNTPYLGNRLSFTSEFGTFILTNFIVTLGVNTTADMLFKTNAFSLNPRRDDLTISRILTITAEFRHCIRGERYTITGQCLDCEANKFLYIPYKKGLGCSDCFDSNTDCNGGDIIGPRRGYARFSNSTMRSIKCPFGPSACLSHTINPSEIDPNATYYCKEDKADMHNETFCRTGWCGAYYTGNLCSECKPGYSKTSNACVDCSSKLYIVLMCIAVPLVILFIVLTVRSSISTEKKKNEGAAPNLFPILMRIFLNYIQLVGIVSSFKFNWDQNVDFVTTTSVTVSSSTTQVFNLDCIAFSGIDFSKSPVRRFNLTLITVTSLPVVLIVLSYVVWNLIYFFKYRKTRHRPSMKARKASNIATTIIVVIFMIYSTIVTTSIKAFQCDNIGDDTNPQYYLAEDYEIECWTGNHLYFAFLVGLPSLLIWGFGIPIHIIFFLKKNIENLGDPAFKKKYGFLYNGYRQQDRYYWEIIILYRKILIIFSTVFLGAFSVEVQGLCVLGIAFTNFVLQKKFQPFESGYLNDLEQTSLFVSSTIIYCGLFFETGVRSLGWSITLLVIMLLANLVFAVKWGWGVIKIIKQKCKERREKKAQKLQPQEGSAVDISGLGKNLEKETTGVARKGSESLYMEERALPNGSKSIIDLGEPTVPSGIQDASRIREITLNWPDSMVGVNAVRKNQFMDPDFGDFESKEDKQYFFW